MVYRNLLPSPLRPVNKFWLRLMSGWGILLIVLIWPNFLSAGGRPVSVCQNQSPYRLNSQLIVGVTLPHHEIAKMVWEPTLNRLAQQKVRRIILLSPNHFWLGKQSVITAGQPSLRDNLAVPIDRDLVTLIDQSSWIEDNPELIWQDHGIVNFIPLIKEKLPESQVVPIMFKKNVSLKQINSLVKELTPYLDNQTALIASLDFAHDVTPPVAAKNNQFTQSLIQQRDYSRLLKLSGSYVDSPAALVLFLKLMDAKKVTTSLVWRSHAGEFNDDCVSETTSYQVWVGSSRN